ncbi:MAG: hypothetical protein ACOCYQ_05310 [Alkalispirochaeta sp.]
MDTMKNASRYPQPFISGILRSIAVFAAAVVLTVLFGGCASQAQWRALLERSAPPSEGESGETGDESEENGSDRSDESGDDGGDSTARSGEEGSGGDRTGGEEGGAGGDALISGFSTEQTDEELRLLRVTEQYWIETPWFGVSSLIVMVTRSLPMTKIVIPDGSLLSGPMRPVDATVSRLPADYRRERIQVSVSFHLGDVPPFVDPGRYNNPEAYY